MSDDLLLAEKKQELREAQESIRQVREAFEMRKRQDYAWFIARYAMAWIAIGVIAGVCLFCTIVLHNHKDYPENIVTVAKVTFFVDLFGLFAHTWRLVFARQPSSSLEPYLKLLTRPVDVKNEGKQ